MPAPDVAPTTRAERGLGRLESAVPVLEGVSQALLVGLTALLAALDVVVVGVSFGLGGGYGTSRLAIASLLVSAAAVAAMALRRVNLAIAVVLLGSVSLAVTMAITSRSASGSPSFASLFALAVLVMLAVRTESVEAAVLASALGVVGVLAEAFRLERTIAPFAAIVCVTCMLAAVGVGAYLRWSDWRRVTGEAAARSDERLEIARELHDLVGHYLTAMVVQAQAGRHVAGRDPGAASEALARIEVAGGEAMAAMRRMVGGLRDDAPTAPGAAWSDIDDLVRNAAADGVPARLHIGPDVRDLSGDLSASAYRIVTESLTNVRRHARDATKVDIEIERWPTSLRIVVADDGTASAPVGHGTYGLVGMSERATALGGTLYAGPSETRGWLVVAELPLGETA